MKIKASTLILVVIISAYVGYKVNDLNRPIVVSTDSYTIQAGTTLWDICNKAYKDNNAESFNEFIDRANQAYPQPLQIGQKIKITNRCYK